MKKSKSIIIVCLFLIILFSVYFVKIQNRFDAPERALVQAFELSGANVVSSEIYFYGSIKDAEVKDLESLKNLAGRFAGELEALRDGKFEFRTTSNDSVDEVVINGTLTNDRIVNISFKMNKNPEMENEKYVSVSVMRDASTQDMEKTRGDIQAVFKKFDIEPRVNSCITGNFDGKVDYERLNTIGRQVLEGTGAQKVEGIRDGNLISVTAYSPSIGSFTRVNGKKVNMNLAVRYNSYENKTYIWLATPLITTEY